MSVDGDGRIYSGDNGIEEGEGKKEVEGRKEERKSGRKKGNKRWR